jgi:trigger factor
MDSLERITEGDDFSAISEPDLDYGAIDVPDKGDFTYQFTIEVRPEFDVPDWKGLELERPSHEISEKDVDDHLARTLARFNMGEAVADEIKIGDVLTINATFSDSEKEISHFEEEEVALRSRLSLVDAVIEDFGKSIVGKKEGDTVEQTLTISENSSNEAYRGKAITAEIEIVEAKRFESKTLSRQTLEKLGFDTSEELRTFVKSELTRQFKYHQEKTLRNQITEKLIADADWDLPPELIQKQTNRELQRQALELRSSGFSEEQITSFINAARRDLKESTIKSLREHFVLEKMAEVEKIEATSEEYDKEIALIAEQSDSSPRSVRARLEKSGQMDALRNQIIERRVIEVVCEAAKISDKEDASFLGNSQDEASLSFAVAPVTTDVPAAKYDSKPEDGKKEGATVKPT